MKHKLEFLNPTWHRGKNVTVRHGGKWVELAACGDEVEVRQTGRDEVLAHGVITQMEYKHFREITLEDLWREHDPECRNPAGLTHAMLRAYPDFTLGSRVTVITFEIA